MFDDRSVQIVHAAAALVLFSVTVLLAGSVTTLRGQLALDGFDPNANAPVHVVVVQPDGKILVGGEFTTLSPNGGPPVARNRIARLDATTGLADTFNSDASATVKRLWEDANAELFWRRWLSCVARRYVDSELG